MIKKWLKYGVVIALFAMGFSHKGNASTEYIVGALNNASLYTQMGIGVTKEVSTETKKIASYKVNPGGWIGDKAAEAQEKVELAQEKVENAQEKKDKLQKRMQWATDAKNSLMAKYKELNTKIAKYKAMADKAIAEGKKIKEQYQTYRADVTDAIDQAKDAKQQLSEGVDAAKGMAGAVGDLAESKLSEAKSKVGMSDSGGETEQNDEQSFSTADERSGEYEADDENLDQNEDSLLKQADLMKMDKADKKADKKELDVAVSQEKATPILSNKADSIRSAGDFAQAVSAEDLKVEMPNTLEGLSVPEPTEVSIEEVMSAVQEEKSQNQPEQQTELNIEDQLINASSRSVKQLNKKSEKEILINKTDKNLSREKFQKENSLKKINTKSEIKSSGVKGIQKKQRALLENEIQEKDNLTARSIRYEKQ